MAKNPSSVWYWNDWLLDPGVRMCSMAARGFWLEMLAIAAAATPYGHVVINGAPCSICDLATATKQRKQDVSRWIRELEKRGVFSRTEDGTIFCRRMVREAEARREKASHRGKASPPRVAHPQRDTKQPDLLDNPPPKTEKFTDSDSDSVAVSQDSPPTSKPLPESLDAPRARPESSEKHGKGNPEGGRCALLEEQKETSPGRNGSDTRSPARAGKPPALKAKIRAQLQQKHARYLQARRRPDELAAYWLAMVDPDPAVAQRALDDTDRRMRGAGWDDMRAWKRENGIVA
jgi:hypothetical protein